MSIDTLPAAHPLAGWGEAGARLATALDAGRVAPAYLFQGVDLAACEALARAFAAQLLDAEPDAALQHRIAVNVHPDVTWITKDKATVISVAALAGYLAEAHRAPLEGRRRVFIVCPADAMEAEGVARYLKTLEEPPATTVFLLCTRAPDRLPATVHSRCASVHLPPESVDAIAAACVAAGFDDDDARCAAAFSGGARSRAMVLLECELLQPIRTFIDDALARPPQCVRATDALLAALRQGADAAGEGVRDRDLAEDALRCVAQVLRDRAAGREALGGHDVHPAHALPAFARVAACSRALALNVSLRAVVLEVALALHEAAAPPR